MQCQWEEEEAKESKYANDLVQLDNGKKISPNPADWKCDETGVTENLWLNLSTGFIGRWVVHKCTCTCFFMNSTTIAAGEIGTGVVATGQPCGTMTK